MFNRIAVRVIHTAMFIVAAGTCACLYAELIITTRNQKAKGRGYDFSWLTYFMLSLSATSALQTLLWIFQSRIYENGRPTVQECVLNAIFALLFLFATAWQFYQTFANQEPLEFLCSTSSYDETVRCRLWQSQLVGCAVCGVMFTLSTILWIVLFRQRPLVFKDLPEEMITSSPTPVASTLAREDAIQREHEEAAIAAEEERRRIQHRQQQQQQQQQQQMQRPAPTSRPTHPYQQQQQSMQHSQSFVNNHTVTPQPLQNQNSSGYLDQGYQQQPYYNHQAQQPPQQHAYTNAETDAYYSNNYSGYNSRPSYDRAPNTPQFQHHGATAPLVAFPGYTEEPGSYVEPPGTSSMPYADYAYGQFNPAETFEDPTSQEAQAHLEYANQLREQQLYHQNMGEALKKQQQLKMQFSRDDSNFPSSGSTTNFFYPQPPQHSGTMPRLPSVPASSASGAGTYGTGTTHNMNTGMVTPGGSTSTDNLRQLCSPQQYPDNVTVAESHHSDDRYKAELLDEVRKTRQEGRENSDNYKVQVGSRGDGGESSGNNRQSTYVPPPM